LMLTLPPTGFATEVTVTVSSFSFAGPATSLPSSALNGIVRAPESSAIAESASLVATGTSFTCVTVTAKSPSLQVPEVSTVTDGRGEYRLTPLPIGTFEVSYDLTGFQGIRREALRLTSGFVAKIDIVMKVGSLEESVSVTGASPVVDVTATSTRQIPANGLVIIENLLQELGASSSFGPVEIRCALPVIAVSRVYNPDGNTSGFLEARAVQ